MHQIHSSNVYFAQPILPANKTLFQEWLLYQKKKKLAVSAINGAYLHRYTERECCVDLGDIYVLRMA